MFDGLVAFLNVLGLVAIGMGVIGLVLVIIAVIRIEKINKEQAKEPGSNPTSAEFEPGGDGFSIVFETKECEE